MGMLGDNSSKWRRVAWVGAKLLSSSNSPQQLLMGLVEVAHRLTCRLSKEHQRLEPKELGLLLLVELRSSVVVLE